MWEPLQGSKQENGRIDLVFEGHSDPENGSPWSRRSTGGAPRSLQMGYSVSTRGPGQTLTMQHLKLNLNKGQILEEKKQNDFSVQMKFKKST